MTLCTKCGEPVKTFGAYTSLSDMANDPDVLVMCDPAPNASRPMMPGADSLLMPYHRKCTPFQPFPMRAQETPHA
jgi:hypothetical protein